MSSEKKAMLMMVAGTEAQPTVVHIHKAPSKLNTIEMTINQRMTLKAFFAKFVNL